MQTKPLSSIDPGWWRFCIQAGSRAAGPLVQSEPSGVEPPQDRGHNIEIQERPTATFPITILNKAAPTTWKFLRTTISSPLKWTFHKSSVQKKALQRPHYLKQLRKFNNLPKELLVTCYTAIIQSVLCSSITVSFGSATRQDNQTIRSAERIIRTKLHCQCSSPIIVADASQPELFKVLPSVGVSTLNTKTSRQKESFFSQAAALKIFIADTDSSSSSSSSNFII